MTDGNLTGMFQSQQLPIPGKWGAEERRFLLSLQQTLDTLFAKFGRITVDDLAKTAVEQMIADAIITVAQVSDFATATDARIDTKLAAAEIPASRVTGLAAAAIGAVQTGEVGWSEIAALATLMESKAGTAAGTAKQEAINALQPDTVRLYTHSYANGVHELTGTGAVGRALLTAGFTTGDTFTLNGEAVTATRNGSAVTDLPNGQWVLLLVGEGQVSIV